MINIDELHVMNLLKELFILKVVLHPNVSEFHLLSHLTRFISPYRYIRGIIGVETRGRQQL